MWTVTEFGVAEPVTYAAVVVLGSSRTRSPKWMSWVPWFVVQLAAIASWAQSVRWWTPPSTVVTELATTLTLLKIPAAVVAVTATEPSTVTALRNWPSPRSPA